MFDFPKNDFSKLFKSTCHSATQFVNHFSELVCKKTVSPDPTELELSPTNSQDLSDHDQDCSAVCQVISTGKDGHKKNTTKRKGPITEEVSPPVPEKKTKAQKKIDKEASCPDVTFLQEVKKHSVPGKFYFVLLRTGHEIQPNIVIVIYCIFFF